jgi:hypothetical protein
MANASLFGEMKSDNPAVISRRKAGQITGIISKDKIKSTQELKTAAGFSVDASSEGKIDLNSVNFFRGGQGGGLTTEISVDYTTGEKTETLTQTAGGETISNTIKSSALYSKVGVGLGSNFGFSFARTSYDSTNDFNFSFGGTSFSDSITTEVTASEMKVGFAGNLGLDFGFYYQYTNLEMSSVSSSGPLEGGGDQKFSTVGLGTGYSSGAFHMEAGYEKYLKDTTDNFENKTYTSARLTGVIEARFGNLAVGYTGRYYIDGYLDIEKVIYTQFVYQNSQYEPRLENAFNFSIGGTKGHSFSGSVTYSKVDVQEKNSLIGSPDAPKAPTTKTAMGASFKYGFAF